jgi:hypothetical protein
MTNIGTEFAANNEALTPHSRFLDKEGYCSSLSKREVRRDFMKKCPHRIDMSDP